MGDAAWEFYLGETAPQNAGPCVTAACVAIRDNVEVVLTCNNSEGSPERYGNWELPGGHLDPINPNDPDSPLESPEAAARRETLEECGVALGALQLFGYRIVHNPVSAHQKYPPTSHMLYYWAPVVGPLQPPSDKSQPARGSFTADSLEALNRAGFLDDPELRITMFGLRAAGHAGRSTNA